MTAAQSLLDQVLTGAFHSTPALTLGCDIATNCTIYIPYAVTGQSVLTPYAINFAPNSGTDAANIATISRSTDASTVFARFTPAAVGSSGTDDLGHNAARFLGHRRNRSPQSRQGPGANSLVT